MENFKNMRRVIGTILAAAFICSCNQTMELRLMSYNVGVFNKDENSSIALTASIVKEVGADIIGLNELDSCAHRTGGVYQLALFAEEMGGWEYHYSKAMPYDGGGYGVGLSWNKGKMAEVQGSWSLVLDREDGSEPRALSVVEFKDFVFATTHLDHRSDSAQLHQSQKITEWMTERYSESDKPVFVVGDFNATPDSRTISEFSRHWTRLSTDEFSHSSYNPRDCIDYIFVLKNKASVERLGGGVCKDIQSGDLKISSDHLPIWVDVRIIR